MSGAPVVVIDASVAIAFIASEQATPATEAFLQTVDGASLQAPAVFAWEVANQCLRRSRRMKFSLELLFRELDALEVAYQSPPDAQGVYALTAFAAEHDLSLFDSAYLALALDLDAPLATRDAALVSAAERIGAPVLDLR